jgi:hypothetical protein
VCCGLLLGLFVARRRRWSAAAQAGYVLLLLLGRLQDLAWVNIDTRHECAYAAYLERTEQTLVDAHHGSGIVKLATVVGCTKQRNKLALREELVAILHDLMGATDEVHVVLL